MRRLALTVTLTGSVLAAGIACTSRAPAPEPRPEADSARRLDIGHELAGHELAETTEGPWRIRSTRSVDGALPSPGKPGAPAKSPELVRSAARELTVGGLAPAATDAMKSGRVVEYEAKSFDMWWESAAVALDAIAEGADRGDDSLARGAAAPTRELRAGATDDNADYEAYLEFLATWVDRKEIQDLYQPLDVRGRQFVRVVDTGGRPVPGAVVSIVDEVADRVLFSATTYGDGRVPYYPHLRGAPDDEDAALLIEALVRDEDGNLRGVRAAWDGTGDEVEVALDDVFDVPEPVQLDVCFVIDTTGSMGDEIESIKASLLKVTEKLRSLGREFDLRYAAVLYRDIGDEYVTATHPFTGDIEAFDEALRAVGAAGGGDGPESLNQAVAQAVDGVEWRDGAAKVAFLIADAPPHMDYAGDVLYGEGAQAALARGIRIHSVAASGLDPVGTLVFRQIAQLTRGKFIFIEYGTPEASAASHGVAGAVRRDNLEDILFEQIRDEVAHFGR